MMMMMLRLINRICDLCSSYFDQTGQIGYQAWHCCQDYNYNDDGDNNEIMIIIIIVMMIMLIIITMIMITIMIMIITELAHIRLWDIKKVRLSYRHSPMSPQLVYQNSMQCIWPKRAEMFDIVVKISITMMMATRRK